ncbi:MAG: PAS domain S-box protein, partial [Deltaproteobacteria bacterium]|nr:PAS domain S-box protein [Deltaproteobacteria bacterium]
MSLLPGQMGPPARTFSPSTGRGSMLSDDRIRAVVDSSPAAIVSFDSDLRVIAYNREAIRLFGPLVVDADNPLIGLIPPRLLGDHLARFRRVLEGESFTDAVVSMNLGGDTPKSLQMSAAPLRDAEGNVTGGVVVALDVTERVRLEGEVRTGKARYAQFVETANEGILSIDPERVITFTNRAMAAMIGYEPADLVGRSFDDFVAPGDMTDHAARMAERRAGKGGRYTRRMVRRDGSECVCSVSAIPLLDDGNRFVGSFGMFTDISEQVAAERLRQEKETQYRLVVDTAIDGFLLVDTDERIIDVNQAYLRSSGYTREEILTLRINDLDAVESPEETRKRTDAIMRDGFATFESMHRAKNGRIWPVEVNTVFQPTGEGRLIAFVRDLQRRRRSEMLLRTRVELSSLALTGTLDELMTAAIDAAELFTGSRIGFFHFVEEDQENLTLQTWSTNTLARMCKADFKGSHYPISQAGVWVDCCTTRKPVIHNDYASLPHKKGMPPGHAEVIRELVVPVLREGKIVAILGVGNKTTDYDANDVETVDFLASLTLDLIERKRAESLRRAADERYRTLVDNLDEMVLATDIEGVITFVSAAS